MSDVVIAVTLSVAGLGFALALLGWNGWLAVSRETNRRTPSAG